MPLYQLDDEDCWFPPIEEALEDPPGLLAIGGDLSVPRLLSAYQQGIFPWYSEGEPLLWWAPMPRMVLPPSNIHVSKSMAKFIRKNQYRVTFDHAFDRVISACGSIPRTGQEEAGSWITQDMQDAYIRLFKGGYAHSVEVWDQGELIGGLYGIALGGMFFGESMFSHKVNASKLAFISLAKQLEKLKFDLIDCQMHTNHLETLGAREMELAEFQDHLHNNLSYGLDSRWQMWLE